MQEEGGIGHTGKMSRPPVYLFLCLEFSSPKILEITFNKFGAGMRHGSAVGIETGYIPYGRGLRV
jgi:hypothetical protein